MLAVSSIEWGPKICMIFSNITLNILWKQKECLHVYLKLHVQNKYWDSYLQEKGFNKENALRIQGH